MSRDWRSESRGSVASLGMLFDSIAPETRADAEEVLREAGYDVDAVGERFVRLASDALNQVATASARTQTRSTHIQTSRRTERWGAALAAAVLLSIGVWQLLRSSEPDRLGRSSKEMFAQGMHGVDGGRNQSTSNALAERPLGERPFDGLSSAQRPTAPASRLPAAGKVRAPAPAGAAAAAPSTAAANPAHAAPHGPPGTLIAQLNADTWETGSGLLPEELLELYKKGEWWHDIYQPTDDAVFAAPDFVAASAKNADRFSIGAHGEIIERETGGAPAFVYGAPFPSVNPTDPTAGARIVWNYFYQSYDAGNTVASVRLDQVDTRSLRHPNTVNVRERFFDGQAPASPPASNESPLLSQSSLDLLTPGQGENRLLSHRFHSPIERDAVWLYVAALRRIRRVPAEARADPLLNTDMAPDDMPYFDGKPEDFRWTLKGVGEALVLFDRSALLEKAADVHALSNGGFVDVDSGRDRFAFQVRGAPGAPSRPLGGEAVLVARPIFIVEGTPISSSYPFGRIVLRIDRQSWRGSYSSKYAWNGMLVSTNVAVQTRFFPVADTWRQYGASLFTMTQRWATPQTATMMYRDPAQPTLTARVPIDDDVFSLETFYHSQ